ncbi:hypothetical protein G7Z17_g6716 [Cylindrodendrum hubeiense]|uniref:Uncharacterized protein n=1 Tax=Cylindrodendrum hubeiense TaxID=595255 RepID=A0A9P5H6T7_9HYPO|nr:hypothetical protein G7Z17_g6716 [Cylindrodendrum hubeiense]
MSGKTPGDDPRPALPCPDVPPPPPPIGGIPRTESDDSKGSSSGKFIEVDSPTASLYRHPHSRSLPNTGDTQLTMSEREAAYLVEPDPSKTDLEETIANGSSLFGTKENEALFEIGKYRSSIAGYAVQNYCLPGDAFCAAIKDQSLEDEVKLEYDSLWLQLQFFWDTMMRMQPNPITSDINETGNAVDLMADIAAGRIIAEIRPGYPPELSLRNIKEFRRRLQRLELVVRTAVNSCGKGPKMYCGCAISLKRYKTKLDLWARLFGPHEEKTQVPGAQNFRIRDMARLLRLEDYLTHVSREFERQLNVTPKSGSLVLTAIGFMEEAITKFFSTDNVNTIMDLKHAWVNMLCAPMFRRSVVIEVQELVKDAVFFKKKHGHSSHRDGCDQKVAKPPKSFIRQMSTPAQPGEGSGSGGKVMSLRTMFRKS